MYNVIVRAFLLQGIGYKLFMLMAYLLKPELNKH